MLATDAKENEDLMHLLLSGTQPIWHDEEPIAAIYFLIHKNTVVYVGQTADVKRRIGEHCKNRVVDASHLDRLYGANRFARSECMEFDSARFIEIDVDMLNELERRCIALFKPKYNRGNGGGGREPKTSRLTRKYVLPEKKRPKRR